MQTQATESLGIEDNFIILDPAGNTYFGSVATRCATNGIGRKLEHILRLPIFTDSLIANPAGQFWVVAIVENEPVIMAGQSTMRGAKHYMKDGRILVWHSLLQNVKRADDLRCEIRSTSSA